MFLSNSGKGLKKWLSLKFIVEHPVQKSVIKAN